MQMTMKVLLIDLLLVTFINVTFINAIFHMYRVHVYEGTVILQLNFYFIFAFHLLVLKPILF